MGELALIASAGFDRSFSGIYQPPQGSRSRGRYRERIGLQFIHIPVEWESPSPADGGFRSGDANVWQRQDAGALRGKLQNVFGFLYQVLFEGADVDAAMSLMQSIWVPNDTWEAFIVRVMNDKGIDYPAL